VHSIDSWKTEQDDLHFSGFFMPVLILLPFIKQPHFVVHVSSVEIYFFK
jgi:hypothetical protein